MVEARVLLSINGAVPAVADTLPILVTLSPTEVPDHT